MHHPLFTDGRGHHAEAECLRSREYGGGRAGLGLLELLEAQRVDLVLAGHEHVLMAKRAGRTLHVGCGAAVECLFYKGRRELPLREADWCLERSRGFVACEADERLLRVRFVRCGDLEVVKEYEIQRQERT